MGDPLAIGFLPFILGVAMVVGAWHARQDAAAGFTLAAGSALLVAIVLVVLWRVIFTGVVLVAGSCAAPAAIARAAAAEHKADLKPEVAALLKKATDNYKKMKSYRHTTRWNFPSKGPGGAARSRTRRSPTGHRAGPDADPPRRARRARATSRRPDKNRDTTCRGRRDRRVP